VSSVRAATDVSCARVGREGGRYWRTGFSRGIHVVGAGSFTRRPFSLGIASEGRANSWLMSVCTFSRASSSSAALGLPLPDAGTPTPSSYAASATTRRPAPEVRAGNGRVIEDGQVAEVQHGSGGSRLLLTTARWRHPAVRGWPCPPFPGRSPPPQRGARGNHRERVHAICGAERARSHFFEQVCAGQRRCLCDGGHRADFVRMECSVYAPVWPPFRPRMAAVAATATRVAALAVGAAIT
jgi:hypothetical protein